MKRGLYFSVLLIIMLAFPVACAKRETQVDRFYGTSYELAKQSQIHNPGAGVKDGPSVGLEGDVASRVINRYEKGFDRPAPKTETYSFSVEGVETK